MPEIRSLTSLRGIFAITILVYHFLELFGIYIQPLSQGVAGFFGLSGFLLYRIYGDNFKVRKYVIRRVFRIMPLFIFSILIFYGSVLLRFTPLWSIYTEETFYFIALPLIIKFKPSSKLLLGLGIVSFVAQYLLFWNAGVYQANLNPTPIWIAYSSLPMQFLPFAIGIIIARKTKNVKATPILQKIDRIIGNRVLMFFGTISFGVYLFHVPMFGWFGPWLGIPATFVLATTTYFLFEKGCIQFARDKTSEIEYK
jgi:peptidoglycan/LPS O-acetylase OafA/YrhL